MSRVGHSILPIAFTVSSTLLEDISSISGSDSSASDLSDDEGALYRSSDGSYNTCARNNPKIVFTLNDGRHLSLYRCLLHGKKVRISLRRIFIDLNDDFRTFHKNPKN